MTTAKTRLDAAVAQQLGVTLRKAAAMILAGEVTVDGRPARKPGQSAPAKALITHQARSTHVSRAAGKLAPVLKQWLIPVTDCVALDVGASTGGFTQTLLEHGAKKVFAVDVGTRQLAWSLRQDPRVVSLEQTDIRALSNLPDQPDLAVVDVSFIALRRVLPAVAALLPPKAPVIALFKPQFEVSKPDADRGRGVITDQAAINTALQASTAWLEQHGWHQHDRLPSEVSGRKGNQEWLLWLSTPASAVPTNTADATDW